MEGASNAGTGRTLPKPNNMFTIPTSMGLEFFKWWCIFLRPFVNLTDREIDVVACFLKHRWELSKHISDASVLDMMTMGDEIKKRVVEECGMTPQHFYVVMSNLRKHNIIVDNKINSRLIPNMRNDGSNYFQLLVLFKDNGGK